MNYKKFIILDSHSLIHRAYHALPFLKTEKQETVNAIYGFFSILIKSINDFNPDYIAATFDFPALNFRHKKFKEYKATRVRPPEDLLIQIPKIKEALSTLNISIFEKQGFEADDIIGTLSTVLYNKDEIEVIIISGDMDNLQLVNEKTKVFLLKRGIKEAFLFDRDKIKEVYQGLESEQLIDYKGLRGDSSDNIPGVPGIGEKTAIDLINDFDSIENLYSEIKKESDKSKKIKERIKDKLIEFEKQAFLSKDLATIKKDVDINFNYESCRWDGFKEKEAKEVFTEYGFYSLLKRIKKMGSDYNNLTLF
jgi:DNA polymerase I